MLGNKALSLLFVFVALLSCRKDPKIPTGNSFKSSDFNLKVGNKWIFLVSKASQKDTMVMEVVSHVVLPNLVDKYNCVINRTDKNTIDTGYFLISENRLTYQGYNENWSYFSNIALEFPLKKGAEWIGILSEDIVKVVGESDDFTVLNTSYSNVFSVKRSFKTLDGYSFNQTLFLSKNVGVIYSSVNEKKNQFPVKKETISLIKYSQ